MPRHPIEYRNIWCTVVKIKLLIKQDAKMYGISTYGIEEERKCVDIAGE
jgi:hypothetical protein